MPNGQPPLQVSLPGWDDAVHIVPERLMSPGERGRRTGERIRRINASPQPEIVSAAQDVLGAYDDIQDAFVTLAVAARLGARFYPPAERIASWLAGGADILNAGQSFQTLATLTKRDKRNAASRFARLPNTYKRRLAETIRTRRFGLRATEILQVAQTSDTIVGVGLSLGAIMAFPFQASSLAVTGGELRVQPLPTDRALMKEYLGPWQNSIQLRSNPPLRLQVEEATARILPERRQEINYLLGEIASSLGRPISLDEALTLPVKERPEVPHRFIRRIRRLAELGDAIRPADLQRELDQDATITMPALFGVLDIAAHIFPPPTGYEAIELIRAHSATLRPQLLPSNDQALWIAAAAGEIDPAVLNQILFMPAAAAMRAAAKVLKAWKWIAPAKDDLTDEEHLAMLAALNLAWQIAGPIFGVFDYTAAEIPADDLDRGRITATESLNTWGARLTDSAMRDVAQQLVSDTARLMLTYLEAPGMKIAESLDPMAAATVRLVELGAVGKSGRPLGGSRIDANALPLVLGWEIYDQLTEVDRQLLHDAFSPGSPTAAPPEMIH